MNTSRSIISGLIMGLGLIQTGGSPVFAGDATPSDNAGVIYVREREISIECAIPTTEGKHRITNYGCSNDQAYTTRFLNVPSALTIGYYNDPGCEEVSKEPSWVIEIKTIKEPTTTSATEYINIEAMAGIPDGSIVAPGVLKVRYKHHGAIHGKLSCIKIERK